MRQDAFGPRKIVEQNLRPIPNRFQKHTSPILSEVNSALTTDNDFYFGFGGCGDALLLLAVAYTNPHAKIIFFANGGSTTLITEFFRLFGIPHNIFQNVMGSPLAVSVYKTIKGHPRFKTSAHLPDIAVDYGDWTRHEQKYTSRLVTSTDWKERFGYLLDGQVVILAPHGSARDNRRQRFLSPSEHENLLDRFSGMPVYSVGSREQMDFYGGVRRSNHFWLSSDRLFGKDFEKEICLKEMLQIINSAKLVFSVDTWLKTYTLLCGIPTSVIQTRFDGVHRKHGEDTTDFIFLNTRIWKGLSVVRLF